MDKIGPICRTVEDCALVFETIRGSDGQDLAVIDAPFNYDPHQDLKILRVGYRSSYIGSEILNNLISIIDQAQLVSITLPSYPHEAMSLILDTEAAAAFDELTRSGDDDILKRQGNYDWPNLFRTARTVPAVEYIQANRLRQKLIQDMATAMKDIDVYVTTHNDSETLFITNLTGHPCVVIPNGGSKSLSFIGKPLDEATALVLAKAYQDTTEFHNNHPPDFMRTGRRQPHN
jgi:Asp-tRNA(Asn)/Glu-tRNA(Gln) amidotransferase A subunit family amidase